MEVVVSSGGIDKLAVYGGLGVREVWMWRDGAFHIFALAGGGYEPREGSELVPGLDFGELAELAQLADQHAALKEYRARLRAR